MKTTIKAREQHSIYILYSLLQYVSAVWGWLSAETCWTQAGAKENKADKDWMQNSAAPNKNDFQFSKCHSVHQGNIYPDPPLK